MKLNIIFLFLLFTLKLSAQPNLVPNPSFEELDSCYFSCFPCTDTNSNCYEWFTEIQITSQLNMCSNWYDPSNASSDYFNSIFNYPGMQSLNTPQNGVGFQYPLSGNSYSGFSVAWGQYYPFYEYISVRLKNILKESRKYCIKYHASPAEQYSILQNIEIAIHPDSLTIWDDSTGFGCPLLGYVPQITNTSVLINDLTQWYELKGSFIANGDEQFLTIGCFMDSSNFTYINTGSAHPYESYTYIDDVSVTELKALHSRDTVICANTVFPITIKAYPGFDFYVWSTGDTTRSITINGPGDYYITAASWCGVTTDTITVAYFDSSQYNQYLGADLNLCPDQFPYLLHTTPLGLNSYMWSNGDTAQNIFLNQGGQLTLTANSQCHTMIDTIIVNVLVAPTLQLGNDTILCNNQNITLQANPAQSYLWNTNDTTQNITVNQTGSYYVNITYSNGCGVSDTISITAYNPINYTLNLGNDTAYCQTDFPIQLQTNNLLFDTYLWSTGSATNTIIATSAGNYFVSANYICGQVTDTITLTLAPNPSVNLGNDTTLCIGQQITLNAGNHNAYTWSNQSITPSITVNEKGIYSVTVTNTFNCLANDNIQVNFLQETAQLLPNDTALFASAFPYTINLSNQYNNYQSPQLSIVNNQLSVETEGVYSLTATDINGCLVSDSISLSLKKFELIVPSIIPKNQNFIINNLPTNSSLKLFDTLGQIVYQNNNYQNNFMSLVANAVYLVELEYVLDNQNKKYDGKLVVVE